MLSPFLFPLALVITHTHTHTHTHTCTCVYSITCTQTVFSHTPFPQAVWVPSVLQFWWCPDLPRYEEEDSSRLLHLPRPRVDTRLQRRYSTYMYSCSYILGPTYVVWYPLIVGNFRGFRQEYILLVLCRWSLPFCVRTHIPIMHCAIMLIFTG